MWKVRYFCGGGVPICITLWTCQSHNEVHIHTHTCIIIIILDQLTNQIQLLNVTTFHYISQFSSAAQSCPTLWDPMDWSTPGFPVHHQLKLISIKSVMSSNHLILCRPLLLPPSIFSSIRVFSNESVHCIKLAKVLDLYLCYLTCPAFVNGEGNGNPLQ